MKNHQNGKDATDCESQKVQQWAEKAWKSGQKQGLPLQMKLSGSMRVGRMITRDVQLDPSGYLVQVRTGSIITRVRQDIRNSFPVMKRTKIDPMTDEIGVMSPETLSYLKKTAISQQESDQTSLQPAGHFQ